MPDIFEKRASSTATFAEACRTLPISRTFLGEQGNAFYALLNAVRSIMIACEERALGKEWSGKIQDGLTAAIWLVCSDGGDSWMNPRLCCDSCGFNYERAQKNIVALINRYFSGEDLEAANKTFDERSRKLPGNSIRHMRDLHKNGTTVEKIADMYCISLQATHGIVKWKTHKGVGSRGKINTAAANRRPE